MEAIFISASNASCGISPRNSQPSAVDGKELPSNPHGPAIRTGQSMREAIDTIAETFLALSQSRPALRITGSLGSEERPTPSTPFQITCPLARNAYCSINWSRNTAVGATQASAFRKPEPTAALTV